MIIASNWKLLTHALQKVEFCGEELSGMTNKKPVIVMQKLKRSKIISDAHRDVIISMHLRKDIIWPESNLEQTKLEIKQYKWFCENNTMFPNYNDNAFQTILSSLNEFFCHHHRQHQSKSEIQKRQY
jgi:hypothetical protein